MPDAGENAALFLRFLLAFVFLLAGAAKTAAPEQFEKVLREFHPVPKRYARPLSLWFPRFELLGAFLLLVGLGIQMIASALALLLVALSVLISINLVAGRQIECGCFGAASSRRMTWLSVLRNAALALGSAWLALHPQHPLTLDSLFSDTSSSITHVDAFFQLTAAVSVVASFLIASALGEATKPAQSIPRFVREGRE